MNRILSSVKLIVVKYKKVYLITISLLAVLILLFLSGEEKGKNPIEINLIDNPTLSVSDVVAPGAGSEAVIDISVSDLLDSVYPAASFEIEFDKEKLSLVSLDEGNIYVTCETGKTIPSWCVNVDRANETGIITPMYLDTTGGERAFTKELAGENGIVFRLKFKVRGDAKEGDVYTLSVNDAVFAANDEKDSISVTNKNLNIKNGSVIIGG